MYNETLRQQIAAAIGTNGNEGITGLILQQKLLAILDNLELGSLFLGFAEAATVPNTQAHGFYIALSTGAATTYTNFSLSCEAGEIALFTHNGTAWVKTRVLKLTTSVAENSSDVPTSGAVHTAVGNAVKDLAPESHAVPSGGTKGQVLTKKDNTDYNLQWATPQEGGTTDYSQLENKPSINSVPLISNKTGAQLGLQDEIADLADIRAGAAAGATAIQQVKTINGQSIVGSGNVLTGQRYINADTVGNLPEAAEAYQNAIGLVPSTNPSGSIDQYVCIYGEYEYEGSNVTGWHWSLAGTSSPIVSVQEVDMYGQMVPMLKEYSRNVFGLGNIADTETPKFNPGHMYQPSTSPANYCVLTFKVDWEKSDYLFSFIANAGATKSSIVNFYDEKLDNWVYGQQSDGMYESWLNQQGSGVGAWIGGFGRNTTGATDNVTYTQVTLESIFSGIEWSTVDGVADHTLSWFKQNCKYVRICCYAPDDPSNQYYRPGYMYEKYSVSQSVIKSAVTPNQIDLYAATIRLPQLWNDKAEDNGDDVEITDTIVTSPWGIIWPSTYNPIGRPTPVIAMLHGSNGYVAEGCLGYTSGGWIMTREKYLAAGFAVMDINGYGVSTQSDDNSKHWGCPAAIETLDKAFEFLKQNFNICDKLLIAGTSMGGLLAMTYAKTHANKVAAIGLFAPNNFAFSMRYLRNGTGSSTTYDGSKELAWGYGKNGYTAAKDDDYTHLVGYVPITECQVIDDETNVIGKFDWNDYPYSERTQTLSKKLIDVFPSIPVRVWQGSADTQVYPNFTKQIVNALRRGNANITLRMCQGVNHDTISSTTFVQNEAVSWFKRFVNI